MRAADRSSRLTPTTFGRLLNVQGGQACAKSVVLQGRRPKDRHDAVTGELIDCAAVARNDGCARSDSRP